MKSKNQTLKDLQEWSLQNNYTMKTLTSNKNNESKQLSIEIAFINETINKIAFIIEITRFDKGNWNITSFTQMFETIHTRFTALYANIRKGQ